jgi:hypothetical protein
MIKRQRGIALLELIIASVIFAMAMLGMFQAWRLCFSLSAQGKEEAVASQIGRAELELSKIQGFYNVPIGDSIVSGVAPYTGTWSEAAKYYDINGLPLDASAPAAQRIFSSERSGTDVGVLRVLDGSQYTLAPTTLRSVLVTVKRVSTGEKLRTMGLHLTRGGL